MNVLEKIGILYALTDCGRRSCDNCIAKSFCRQDGTTTTRLRTINEISAEVRTIIKERDEAIAKVNAQEGN